MTKIIRNLLHTQMEGITNSGCGKEDHAVLGIGGLPLRLRLNTGKGVFNNLAGLGMLEGVCDHTVYLALLTDTDGRIRLGMFVIRLRRVRLLSPAVPQRPA